MPNTKQPEQNKTSSKGSGMLPKNKARPFKTMGDKTPTTDTCPKQKSKWFYHMRINKDQIRQFHVAMRELSESEIKRVPNKWWVSEQLIDPRYTALKSILEQYKLRGNL